jgi:hypothetical protein
MSASLEMWTKVGQEEEIIWIKNLWGRKTQCKYHMHGHIKPMRN